MSKLTNSNVGGLVDVFDAVVMLTWSNWHTEPRSNRYHYATRFSRHLRVIFVQPDSPSNTIFSEKIPGTQIEIIHVPTIYNLKNATLLNEELAKRGIFQPLIWIYNVFFIDFVNINPALTCVYHATEDYVSPPEQFSITESDISSQLRLMLKSTDLVIAVSEGVANSYRRYGGYTGEMLVLPNGCDFAFWEASQAFSYQPPDTGRPVAFYQGGMNIRLDLSLLEDLSERLPDWDFWFCGAFAAGTPRLEAFLARQNVQYHGMLHSDDVARLARQARVGLIPFKQDGLMRRSLPLKAYEYLACGLPVVTIPIDALSGDPKLFRIATDAVGFAQAILDIETSRDEPTAIEQRLIAARAQSYDLRFAKLVDTLMAKDVRKILGRSRLNILMLYDDRSTFVHTIKEHLDAFANYSHHNYHFLPATGSVDGIDGVSDEALPQLGFYDAIAIHYSVRVSIDDHLSSGLAQLLADYRGPKLLFIQDEYERTETARRWIERLGIDAVFTNVPLDAVETIYPRMRFPQVDFLPTLTGYVPEDPVLDEFITPLADRQILIGYRGRILPHHYGALGQDKHRIGVDMKRHALAASLRVDIEVDDTKRIYGTDWYKFIGSCRATLGTESGANVFDDDGSLHILSREHADMPYNTFAAKYMAGREGVVMMNQISPKIFEAIRLRTALVLYEGKYSGVVEANQHYIPLSRDFSNIGEVFAKLNDVSYIAELTERAYDDIIRSGRYSYAAFVDGIDRYLERRTPRGARAVILSTPVIARYSQNNLFMPFGPTSPLLTDKARVDRLEPRESLIAAHLAIRQGLTPPSSVKAYISEINIKADAAKAALDSLVASSTRCDDANEMHVKADAVGVALQSLVASATAHPNTLDVSVKQRVITIFRIVLRRIWRLIPRRLRYALASRFF